jgi:hypothetical protein
MATVGRMRMSIFLVFHSPDKTHAPSSEGGRPAQFTSTRGQAASWLEISQSVDLSSINPPLQRETEDHFSFGHVKGLVLRTYLFGISILEVSVDINAEQIDQAVVETWDTHTDVLQKRITPLLEPVLGKTLSPMWTTVLFTTSTGDPSGESLQQALPRITKVAPLTTTGFVTRGCSGIGMSWVEVAQSDGRLTSGETYLDMVVGTERDAIAFCAGIYRLYDDIIADYGKWLTNRRSERASRSASEFRYIESIRVHRNLHLGPSERGLNSGLWDVWGMPEMVSNLESCVERLERDVQSAAQRATALAQNGLAIGAAVIAVLVGVDPVRTLLNLSDTARSSAIVLAILIGIEAVIVGLVVGVSRRSKRA